MNSEYQDYATELEHQELVKHCHSLVAAIANRPGAIKLLKGIVPTLETFAAYKGNRSHNVQSIKLTTEISKNQ